MQLLDLPLDCFRYMMTIIARDFNYDERNDEFLRLRLTSRLMDAEVLRTLAMPAFFKWKRNVRTLETGAFFDRVKGSVPSSKRRLPLPPGYPDFIASFLQLRPLRQDPWNANISSALNHVVDAIMAADGIDVNEPSRQTIMRNLCRHVLEMKRWKENLHWFSSVLFPQSDFADKTESLDFNVLLASLLLRRRTTLEGLDIPALMLRSSNILGSLLTACIKSGQVELVASLLDTGIDVNIPSLALLETATASDKPEEMLRLLFSPRYGLDRSETGLHRIARALKQAVSNDLTEGGLYLVRTCDTWQMRDDIKFACGHACIRNNMPFVRALDEAGIVDFSSDLEIEWWVLPQVIFYGHQEMLSFMLERGATIDGPTPSSRKNISGPSAMLAAVCGGDISMVRYLARDCGVVVPRKRWCDLLRVAASHRTRRHNALIKAVFDDPSILEHQSVSAQALFKGPADEYADLLVHACYHGNEFLIRKIAEAGANLDIVEGYFNMPPVRAALFMGQHAAADLLIELGAEPVELKREEFSGMFRREVDVNKCTRWWV